jgi:flagellar basal body-associated protein FliL
VLIAAIVGTVTYLNVSIERDAGVSYATLDPVNVTTRGFTLRATIAIQTRAGKAEWAAKNKAKLQNVFQKTLSAADPASMRSAAGIQALQAQLKDDANRALGTENLEAVYVTDFLVMDDAE